MREKNHSLYISYVSSRGRQIRSDMYAVASCINEILARLLPIQAASPAQTADGKDKRTWRGRIGYKFLDGYTQWLAPGGMSAELIRAHGRGTKGIPKS